MGRTILITSCKGGVGKSTAAVNIAAELAQSGQRVLLIDCDLDVRCLDLLLGCENRIVYDLSDVACGRIALGEGCFKIDRLSEKGRLELLAAPMGNTHSDRQGLKRLTDAVPDIVNQALEVFDYVVLDCPPGFSDMFYSCSQVADIAYIIAGHSHAAVRAAEKSADALPDGVTQSRLIINFLNPKGILRGTHPGILDIIESTRLRLIGIIPVDTNMRDGQERGLTAGEHKSGEAADCFRRIVGRTLGDNIPLPQKLSGIRTDRLYYSKGVSGLK
ncbi:MAG: P-loop NTPase [Eubacteriales bacterium]